jgi:hypothetical protein
VVGIGVANQTARKSNAAPLATVGRLEGCWHTGVEQKLRESV